MAGENVTSASIPVKNDKARPATEQPALSLSPLLKERAAAAAMPVPTEALVHEAFMFGAGEQTPFGELPAAQFCKIDR